MATESIPTFASADDLSEYVYGELGFCGCGNPTSALSFIRSLLLLIQKRQATTTYQESKPIYDEIETLLRMKDDDDPGMGYCLLYFLDNKGLLEHGSSIIGAWLTPKGEALLEAITAYPDALD